MHELTDLSAAHDRAVQAVQLFEQVCDTDPERRRAVTLTLRGERYRVVYTPRRQFGPWDRVLAWLGFERRVAVRRLPPDPTIPFQVRCRAAMPSQSDWLRGIAKSLLWGKLQHPGVIALNEPQRGYARLRAAAELYADCDIGAFVGGQQWQAVLYGAAPTLMDHLVALARARAQRVELSSWQRRETSHAPCYEVVPAAVVKTSEQGPAASVASAASVGSGGSVTSEMDKARSPDVRNSPKPGPQPAASQAR